MTLKELIDKYEEELILIDSILIKEDNDFLVGRISMLREVLEDLKELDNDTKTSH